MYLLVAGPWVDLRHLRYLLGNPLPIHFRGLGIQVDTLVELVTCSRPSGRRLKRRGHLQSGGEIAGLEPLAGVRLK